MKKYQSFLSENFQFLEVKFSIYLNRHVFLMMFRNGIKADFQTIKNLYRTLPTHGIS